MYELYNPIILSDWNEYFVRAVSEKDNTYFHHFLCRYEKTLDGKVKQFQRRYELDNDRTDDLKQIFSSVLWTELQEYNPECGIPFLQLIKYDVQNAWHEYVRTSCGVTHIPTDYTYRLIRKAAQIYYAESDHESEVAAVSENLKLSEEKANELIEYAKQFKYADSIVSNNTDDEEFTPCAVNEYMLPESPSAEAEYLTYEQRQQLWAAAQKLSPKERQIIELSVGVCLDCIGLIEKKAYEQIALLQGAADAGVIEKKRKRILKKLRDSLNK